MTLKLQRFDFGALRDFRGPITVKPVEEEIHIEQPVVQAPPTFSEADIESARMAGKKSGYTDGFAAGLAQAKAESDQTAMDTDAIIQQLGESLVVAEKLYQHLLMKESTDLSSLILMIAKKVAGEALEARSIETITAMVTRCLPVLFSKPRLLIDVHPTMLQPVLERMETYLRAQGFEGDIQFRSNAELGPHDISLDWGAGQASRSTEQLWQEIETLIARIPLEITFAETLGTNPPTPPTDIETGA
jgi:flagellar assembly protein FliH